MKIRTMCGNLIGLLLITSNVSGASNLTIDSVDMESHENSCELKISVANDPAEDFDGILRFAVDIVEASDSGHVWPVNVSIPRNQSKYLSFNLNEYKVFQPNIEEHWTITLGSDDFQILDQWGPLPLILSLIHI